jgi:O-antigen/teichoic acid export membrane protein
MSIAENSGFVILANILQLGTSLALGVLGARLLGPAGKGELYLVIQLSSMLGLMLAAGLGPSYQYHIKNGSLGLAAVLSHAASQTAVVCGITLLLVVFARPLLPLAGAGALSTGMVQLTGIAIVANVLINYTSCVLMTFANGILWNSLISVATSVGTLLLFVVIVAWLHFGTYGAVLAYVMLLGVRVAWIAWLISKHVWRQARPGWKASGQLYRFGLTILLGNIMLTYAFRIDVFLVNGMLSTAALGIYSVAVAFAELVLMCPGALGIALFAHLPGVNHQEQLRILGKASRLTLATSAIAGLSILAISHPLVTLLMGRRFEAAVVPLCVLVPGLVAMSVNYVFTNYFAAKNQSLLNAACFAIGAAVDVGADLWLIPRMGVTGAAVGSTIAYIVITMSFLLLLHTKEGLRLESVLVINREDVLEIRQRLKTMMPRHSARLQRHVETTGNI